MPMLVNDILKLNLGGSIEHLCDFKAVLIFTSSGDWGMDGCNPTPPSQVDWCVSLSRAHSAQHKVSYVAWLLRFVASMPKCLTKTSTCFKMPLH